MSNNHFHKNVTVKTFLKVATFFYIYVTKYNKLRLKSLSDILSNSCFKNIFNIDLPGHARASNGHNFG